MLPWQMLARETGAILRYLECGQSGIYTSDGLRAALTPNTKIFAVAQISNVFGRINPVADFAEICHENGRLIVCDGAQSVPHIPVDVQALDVDSLYLRRRFCLCLHQVLLLSDSPYVIMEKKAPFNLQGE